jgi:hypothetical protein
MLPCRPVSWEFAGTMTKTASFCSAGLLALAACQGPDPHPLSWDATYNRPYESLTNCLAQNTSPDYLVMPAIDQRQKIGGVLLTQRSNKQKAGEFDVYAIDNGTSRVVFRSAIRTVGGSSYIEDQMRQVANGCGM